MCIAKTEAVEAAIATTSHMASLEEWLGSIAHDSKIVLAKARADAADKGNFFFGV